MEKYEIEAHMSTTKAGVECLSPKFLIDRAHFYADKGIMHTFEAILALLIYGLVLFSYLDHLVDIDAIWIFLKGNPIFTLLFRFLLLHSSQEFLRKKDDLFLCTFTLQVVYFSLS